jgi:hypothetical protein
MLVIEKNVPMRGDNRGGKHSTKRFELIDVVSKLEVGDSVFVPVDYFKQVTVRARVSEIPFVPPRTFICETSKEGVRVFRLEDASQNGE